MTRGAESLFLDANALIYATDQHSPLQPVALAAILHQRAENHAGA